MLAKLALPVRHDDPILHILEIRTNRVDLAIALPGGMEAEDRGIEQDRIDGVFVEQLVRRFYVICEDGANTNARQIGLAGSPGNRGHPVSR